MNTLNGKTVLITGATGLIGSSLTEALMKNDNIRVTVLARNENKIKKLFSKYLDKSNFSYLVQDISEPIKIDTQYDFIFHGAGAISGEIIKNNPVDIIKPNILGAINCLELLKKQGYGRFIAFSSATVYGNNTEHNIAVNEADTQITNSLDESICAYSQSKRMTETLAKAYYSQYGVESIIARFGYVYGFSKFPPNTAFFNFIKTALAGNDIVLNGKCFERRDNIYVKDAVKLLITLANEGKSGESYNVASGGQKGNFVAIDEMAEEIVKAANKITGKSAKVIKLKFEDTERKAGIIMNMDKTLDLTCIEHNEPISDIETGISETVFLYSQYNDNGDVDD